WLTALGSLAVGAAFFGLWFWLLPQWLGFSVDTAGTARWRWLAAIPSVLGFYRYVRNPMYVGFAAGWIGLWVIFGHPDPVAIAVVAAVAAGIHLFVILYEEPTLRKKFGAQYEEYRGNVRRWWPRWRAWNPPERSLL